METYGDHMTNALGVILIIGSAFGFALFVGLAIYGLVTIVRGATKRE